MSKNDEKIKELLVLVNKKKAGLGDKPKMTLKSNGIIKKDGKVININTINSIETCLSITAGFLGEYNTLKEAAQVLNVDFKDVDQFNFKFQDVIDDLKLKVSIIKWKKEADAIKQLEEKLKALRSEDLKTEQELNDITNQLNS